MMALPTSNRQMDLDVWSPCSPPDYRDNDGTSNSSSNSPSATSILTSCSTLPSPVEDCNFENEKPRNGPSDPSSPRPTAPAKPLTFVGEKPEAAAALCKVKSEGQLPTGKRPRGRPRKNPLPIKTERKEGKTNNGRSKTGCLTCRQRKKKCDETKPNCENCRKNNLACQGYATPVPWQGSRMKKGKNNGLPPLWKGMRDDIDRILLRHFCDELAQMLSLGNTENAVAINDAIMPLTVDDPGLLYSVLSLSGYKLSHGPSSLELDDALRREIFSRTCQHCLTAVSLLTKKNIDANYRADDATVAHMLVLCLETIMKGDRSGQYRVHMSAVRECILTHRSSNEQFRRFSEDFLMFHSTCSHIVCTPANRLPTYFPERFRLPKFVPPEAGTYFGILDDLFLFLHKITELRDAIRDRRMQRLTPAVDFPMLYQAERIDQELRDWTCHQPPGTTYETASMLYHKCTWIYLHRTVLSTGPDRNLRTGVDEGLRLLALLRDDNAVQAILVMPLFLLGCSAFEPDQRPAISDTFDVLLARRGRATNVLHVRSAVDAMWKLMDAGSEDSWDWERLLHSLELDFLLS